SGTWEYLEDPKRLKNFNQALDFLQGDVNDGDTLFMYMSDVLFIPPIIDFILHKKPKIRTVLNLFHSGHYFIQQDERQKNIVDMLRHTATIRNRLGVFLTVEGPDVQERIYEQTGERLPVIPMMHSTEAPAYDAGQKIPEPKKKVISLISATIERGFFQY